MMRGRTTRARATRQWRRRRPRQGLTLVRFSAQPELFLSITMHLNTPEHTLTPKESHKRDLPNTPYLPPQKLPHTTPYPTQRAFVELQRRRV